MRPTRPAGRHQSLRSGAAVGITCLALLAGGLVGGIQAAEAASIPDNPCVSAPPPPPPVTSSPVLTRVRMSTTVVDVRRHAKTVVVTLKAHDSVPLSRIVITVARLAGKPADIQGTATLVSGTATDGTWRAPVTVPRGIPDGRYRVGTVLLYDVAGGFAHYRPSRLGPRAWQTTFLVRSHHDRTAPTVTGFSVSTRAVDTTVAARAITLSVTVRDRLSGVAFVRVMASGIDRALEPAQSAYQGFDVRLTRTTAHQNRWSGRVVVPTWAGTSTWGIQLAVKDRRGNHRHFFTPGMAARGWQSTLRVTSGRDPTPPSLVDLSFAPSSVDARAGAARVDFTFRVTDTQSGPSADVSGLGRVRLSFNPVKGGMAFGVVTSVSGTATDRTYRGHALVGRCGLPLGTWVVDVQIGDNSGNVNWYGADELAALGFPSELLVRQVDAWAPTVAAPTSVSAGQPITMTFSEPVLLADPMADTVEVTVDNTPVTGSWECRDGSDVVVVCDADGAEVVTASFLPTTAFAPGNFVLVRRRSSPPARIGIYDLAGVPLYEVNVHALVV